MTSAVSIGPGRLPGYGRAGDAASAQGARSSSRSSVIMLGVIVAFGVVSGQLVRLASDASRTVQSNISTPIATGFARPDLVDRNGRLLANDVELQSLYADPFLVIDRDEVAEKLRSVLPDIDEAALRSSLADRSKRFVWIRRGLSPAIAQRIHDLGLPGLAFRPELRRAYPAGTLSGHVLGGVDIDNAAVAGIERYLDQSGLIDPVHAATPTGRRPVALSIDVGVQHAVTDELAKAIDAYKAKAAVGLVMDVDTGEVVAAASLPSVDPGHPEQAQDASRRDRLMAGTFELGSVFKLLSVGMALDSGSFHPDTIVDVTAPLTAGRFNISDLHGGGRPLSVTEIFTKSSNVGAAMLSLALGTEKQRSFLEKLGMLSRMSTEAGGVAEPLVPGHWDRAETITISYGHGLAVAPLQFAAAAAALLNGGHLVKPTFLKQPAATQAVNDVQRVISAETSRQMKLMMRRNVAQPGGTGRRADATGYRVGGKTGTAEIAVNGRYDPNLVISSFLGAFPMEKPRYLTFMVLFEPARTAASDGEITAGHTAAPLTARVVERIAPLLSVLPENDHTVP